MGTERDVRKESRSSMKLVGGQITGGGLVRSLLQRRGRFLRDRATTFRKI